MRTIDRMKKAENILFILSILSKKQVCVSVQCPSTGRRYLIRVPPNTRTCHQAAAWIAGFDDPRKYNPIIET